MNGSERKLRMGRAFLILISICLSSLVSVLISEGLFRLLYPESLYMGMPNIVQADPDVGYHLKAGLDFTFIDEGNQVRVKTTPRFLRDRPRDYQKHPQTRRIIMLGDSFTYGVGVNMEETFSAVLEELFRKNDRKVEVINGGVPGYSTSQAYRWLKKELIKYEPDVVILNFYINDFVENLQPLSTDGQGNLLVQTRETSQHPSALKDMYMRVRESFRLINYIIMQLKRSPGLRRLAVRLGYLDVAYYPEYSVLFKHLAPQAQKMVENSCEIIRELHAYSGSHNFRLVGTFHPPNYLVQDESWQDLIGQYNIDPADVDRSLIVERLRQCYQKIGVPYIDLVGPLTAFQRRHPDLYLFNQHGGHPAPRSHRMVAELMFDKLAMMMGNSSYWNQVTYSTLPPKAQELSP